MQYSTEEAAEKGQDTIQQKQSSTLTTTWLKKALKLGRHVWNMYCEDTSCKYS